MNTSKTVAVITFIAAVALMYAAITNHPTLIIWSAGLLLWCVGILVYLDAKKGKVTITIREIDESEVPANILAAMRRNQLASDKRKETLSFEDKLNAVVDELDNMK